MCLFPNFFRVVMKSIVANKGVYRETNDVMCVMTSFALWWLVVNTNGHYQDDATSIILCLHEKLS